MNVNSMRWAVCLMLGMLATLPAAARAGEEGEHDDATARRSIEEPDDVEQRALAGAGGSDEGDELARLEPHIDPVERPRDGGRAVMAFFGEVGAFAKEHAGDEAMKPFIAPLSTALGHLQQATMWLMQNAMTKPDNAGAAATDYMQLAGLVVLGYMWARMAKVAQDKIAAGDASSYLSTKLVTGRFFMERMLPETTLHLARIQTGCATTMELPAEAF